LIAKQRRFYRRGIPAVSDRFAQRNRPRTPCGPTITAPHKVSATATAHLGHPIHVVALGPRDHVLDLTIGGNLHTHRVFFGMSVCCGRFVW
jgi:hypothetical protein